MTFISLVASAAVKLIQLNQLSLPRVM